MEFIDIPTEQTTAATDLLIALLAGAAIPWLQRRGPAGARGRIWRGVFALLAIAASLGAVAHGIVLAGAALEWIWRVIYLALALLVAAFLLAAIRDLAGDARARQALPVLAVIAVAFYAYTLTNTESFLPFILYELAAMLLSLACYAWMTAKNLRPGAGWIAAAVATNIAAAVIQATRTAGFTLVWTFDHNGVFHLVQMIAIVLLMQGLRNGADAAAGRKG
jgi:hypothetical protein